MMIKNGLRIWRRLKMDLKIWRWLKWILVRWLTKKSTFSPKVNLGKNVYFCVIAYGKLNVDHNSLEPNDFCYWTNLEPMNFVMPLH